MEFLLNRLKADSSRISSFEDDMESRTFAKYTAFKTGSTALVRAFHKEVDIYGSIHNIPRDILQKYSIPFGSLLDLSKNLRDDLQRQVNKNNRDLEHICELGEEKNFIHEIALKKRDKLYQKIEYFDDIEILRVAIEFYMNKE